MNICIGWALIRIVVDPSVACDGQSMAWQSIRDRSLPSLFSDGGEEAVGMAVERRQRSNGSIDPTGPVIDRSIDRSIHANRQPDLALGLPPTISIEGVWARTLGSMRIAVADDPPVAELVKGERS